MLYASKEKLVSTPKVNPERYRQLFVFTSRSEFLNQSRSFHYVVARKTLIENQNGAQPRNSRQCL